MDNKSNQNKVINTDEEHDADDVASGGSGQNQLQGSTINNNDGHDKDNKDIDNDDSIGQSQQQVPSTVDNNVRRLQEQIQCNKMKIKALTDERCRIGYSKHNTQYDLKEIVSSLAQLKLNVTSFVDEFTPTLRSTNEQVSIQKREPKPGRHVSSKLAKLQDHLMTVGKNINEGFEEQRKFQRALMRSGTELKRSIRTARVIIHDYFTRSASKATTSSQSAPPPPTGIPNELIVSSLSLEHTLTPSPPPPPEPAVTPGLIQGMFNTTNRKAVAIPGPSGKNHSEYIPGRSEIFKRVQQKNGRCISRIFQKPKQRKRQEIRFLEFIQRKPSMKIEPKEEPSASVTSESIASGENEDPFLTFGTGTIMASTSQHEPSGSLESSRARRISSNLLPSSSSLVNEAGLKDPLSTSPNPRRPSLLVSHMIPARGQPGLAILQSPAIGGPRPNNVLFLDYSQVHITFGNRATSSATNLTGARRRRKQSFHNIKEVLF